MLKLFHLLRGACLAFGGFATSLCTRSGFLLSVLLADARDFVVELARLGKVAVLVVVGLVFEIFTVSVCHGLPLFADLLHDLEGAHVWVGIDDFGSRLLHEDHVGGEALLGFLDRFALLL